MMLEKVQVPPGELFKIMRLTKLATMGAGELGSPIGADPNMEFMGCFPSIEPLVDDPSRGSPSLVYSTRYVEEP